MKDDFCAECISLTIGMAGGDLMIEARGKLIHIAERSKERGEREEGKKEEREGRHRSDDCSEREGSTRS